MSTDMTFVAACAINFPKNSQYEERLNSCGNPFFFLVFPSDGKYCLKRKEVIFIEK